MPELDLIANEFDKPALELQFRTESDEVENMSIKEFMTPLEEFAMAEARQ